MFSSWPPSHLDGVHFGDTTEDERWLDVGLSADGRLLVVWYTERGETGRSAGRYYTAEVLQWSPFIPNT